MVKTAAQRRAKTRTDEQNGRDAKANDEKDQNSITDSKKRITQRLKQEYQRLDTAAIEREVQFFQQMEQRVQQEWEEESAKYEETVSVKVDEKTLRVPRRNYANSTKTVNDTTLFPYHSACYPLLDAYDCLYDDLGQQPVPHNVVLPSHVPPSARRDHDPNESQAITGYMPCSLDAIGRALLGSANLTGGTLHTDEEGERGENFSCFAGIMTAMARAQQLDQCMELSPSELLDEITVEDRGESLSLCLEQAFWDVRPVGSLLDAGLDRPQRTRVLLRLLRHSLSELQRDHRLALIITSLLQWYHDFDDVEVMREWLVMWTLEYLDGTYNSGTSNDFYPDDWTYALSKIAFRWTDGISNVTTHHATIICAFVRWVFYREFHFLAENNGLKSALKRSLLERREETQERSASSIPDMLVNSILSSFGKRAMIDRLLLSGWRVRKSVDPSIACAKLRGRVEQYLDSFLNSVGVLVSTADMATALLPRTERFYPISSGIVESLLTAFVLTSNEWQRDYLGFMKEGMRRIKHFSRFAESLEQRHDYDFSSPTRNVIENHDALEVAIIACCDWQPPKDVRDAVRGLYACDLVDVRLCGFGYGDFIVWCHCEATPLDLQLFVFDSAFPIEEADEEDDTTDVDGYYVNWEEDESGHMLTSRELMQRYDTSLVALTDAWHKPWSKETHSSYQPDFRLAVATILCCTHKLGFPDELNHRLIEYMNRSWWPDERQECNSYECHVQQRCKMSRAKLLGKKYRKPTADLWCSKCQTRVYCSQACMEQDYKDGHKKVCGRPPFRRPQEEEKAFLACLAQADAGTLNMDAVEMIENQDKHDGIASEADGNGEDGSWSSIDSDEDADEETHNQSAQTKLISRFYKSDLFKIPESKV